jgi:hypothetical protein
MPTAPRRRVLRRAVEYPGDLLARSLRTEGDASELLDFLDNRPQPLDACVDSASSRHTALTGGEDVKRNSHRRAR